MAKKKKKKSQKQNQWAKQMKYELAGLLFFTLAIIALFRFGFVGEIVVQLFRFFLGEWHVLLTLFVLFVSVYIIVKRKFPPLAGRRLSGLYIAISTFLLLSHLMLFENLGAQSPFQSGSALLQTWELYWLDVSGNSAYEDIGGGMIGALLFTVSMFLFDGGGTRVVSVFLFVISFILLTGISMQGIFLTVVNKMKESTLAAGKAVQAKGAEFKQAREQKKEEGKSKKEKRQAQSQAYKEEKEAKEAKPEERPDPVIYNFADQAYSSENRNTSDKESQVSQREKKDKETEEAVKEPLMVAAETTNEDYQVPPIELLSSPKQNSQKHEKGQISSNARKLEQTLLSFGVKAKVNEVHLGPAVTKYEVQPDIGVKVSKIVNLADDLALALAAKDIRIEAPIPGKSAIGIEVPNQEVAMVGLREVLEAGKKKDEHILSVALGRDISGEPVLASLNKMPHLLVAGATGSGKSVCINGIITSILMKAKPHEVKLMMIDPKMVELNVYNGIPHLLTPVVTEPKKASQALKKAVAEMERRYDLFSHSGTRNIEGYNDLIRKQNEKNNEKQPTLPYIIVIVDELADLMMVASSDVEDAITRLAQMARAAGIHMIIATQRPSVDVITGVIKANIPSRIAFGVSSQTDSRTILDSGGAEKLLGRGDMLFIPVGANKSTRIQGAFVSDEEVEAVVNAVIAQQKASYQEEMMPEEVPEVESEVQDDLYDDAVSLVMQMNSASVSMLQRRFRIGYTRAARLIDEMEVRGIVGPYEGSKPREVLVDRREEQSSEQA
ncbi:DNA translocase FtsK [Thalassorhabdus alkalitolerans]|uniref:DNA translocase FtsK n=1 Tax=Thalassorhabdus alkalitolerans TaxID=2282697 RepID=A0ABW0YIE1_9BACI